MSQLLLNAPIYVAGCNDLCRAGLGAQFERSPLTANNFVVRQTRRRCGRRFWAQSQHSCQEVQSRLGSRADRMVTPAEWSGGLVDRQSRAQIETEDPVGVYVAVHKRTQGAQIVGTHRIRPAVLAKHLLDHQGVDVHEADLE